MTGTNNQIPEKERRPWYTHWQLLLVVAVSAFGIFLGGVTSGYFMFRAESLQRTEARDKAINALSHKVDQLPSQIKTEEEKK
ncbi:hypothetical protein KXR87_12975 [Yokenella regensburgei]|uniref:hypothetical protein n=1 Tax=Yokenella regensburgei TaxID=158877 RepID=UPI003F16F203